jgi:hypothetical protein
VTPNDTPLVWVTVRECTLTERDKDRLGQLSGMIPEVGVLVGWPAVSDDCGNGSGLRVEVLSGKKGAWAWVRCRR